MNAQLSTSDSQLVDERELRLLEEIERSPHLTQRGLSRRLSIGVSVTNLLVRGLVGRGYVRATQAGWKRSLAYSLTPKGMARRVDLVRGYIRRVLGTYQSMREAFGLELASMGLERSSRVVVYCPDSAESTKQVAELVFLALKDRDVKRIDFVVGDGSKGMRIVGQPVRPLRAEASEEQLEARDSKGSPPDSLLTPHSSRLPCDWVIIASLDGAHGALRFPGVADDRVMLPLGNGRRARA